MSPQQERAALRAEYGAALTTFDLGEARRVALRAAADGASLSALFHEVLRPAVHDAVAALPPRDRRGRVRVLADAVAGTLDDLVRPRTAAPVPGARARTAIVSMGAEPLDALDGRAIADALGERGWSTLALDSDVPPDALVDTARDTHAELAVLTTSSAVDVLRLSPVFRRLRLMADPPVIVACSLGSSDELRRARGIGADEEVAGLAALAVAVDRHLPMGPRRWGVGIRRLGAQLVLHPTGDLDGESVRRLRDVATSRAGSFQVLVLELADVAGWTDEGACDLSSWCDAPDGAAPRVDAAGPMLDALRTAGLHHGALLDAPERAALRWGTTA